MADSQRPLGEQLSSRAIDAGNTAEQAKATGLSTIASQGSDKLGGVASGAVTNANARAMSVPAAGGWRSFIPPNASGRFPWRLRWLGLLPFFAALMLTGWWAWVTVEDEMNKQALAHLACADIDTTSLDIDWSYRSVTVDGELPAGVTADDVRDVIDNGADDVDCVVNADVGFNQGDRPHVDTVTVPAALFSGAAAAIPDVAASDGEPVEAPEPTAVPTETPTVEAAPVAQIAALTASAAFDGQIITLTGDVATEAQRIALVVAAIGAVGESNVIDELTTVDADPSDTGDARVEELSVALEMFDGVSVLQGSASVTDEALTYDLIAPTAEAAEALDLAGTGSIRVIADAPAPSFTG